MSVGGRSVALDDTSLRAPKGELSKEMVSIRFGGIESCDVSSYIDTHTLAIRDNGA